MIKELLIKNFEAHKKFRAKLDPYITTFIGSTDSGKSSIIRALKWLSINRPLGDKFLNDITNKPAFVGIRTEEGTISRKKGKGINEYKINDTVLKAFGTDIPDQVQEFLNIEELNFQFQFDAPYWFMISPGEVSKQLNKIVDLDIIDSTLSNLSSKVRNHKTAVTLSENSLKTIEDKLKELSFVEEITEDYNEIEKLQAELEEKSSYLDALSESVIEIERYTLKEKTLLGAKSEAERVLKKGNNYIKVFKKAKILKNIIKDIKEAEGFSKMKVPNISSLLSASEEYAEKRDSFEELLELIDNIELEKKKVWQKEKELLSEEAKRKKWIGKTCPACGQTVTTKSLQ